MDKLLTLWTGSGLFNMELGQVIMIAIGLLLLFLVFQLAVVDDLADGRIGIRRHLDQVETGLGRGFKGCVGGHDALLLAVFVDQKDPRYADIPVGARPFLLGRCGIVRSTGYGLVSLVASELIPSNPTGFRADQA